MLAVDVRQLTKTYLVPEREAGLGAAVRSVFRRRTRAVEAVAQVSFALQPGEFVGFVGPNGAGKTTTLKMLSGLLHPTAGQAQVLGHVPARRERAFLRRITLVMGQRNQLLWDIPVIDSFERNRVVYRVPAAEYRRTLDELTELLDLAPLLERPVRNLSLGERMKCEIAVALLHRPQVLFLAEYNRAHRTTVLLTSHYMADVQALCRRIIMIDHGRILFDGALQELIHRFSPHKTIVVELDRDTADLSSYGEVVASEGSRHTLRVPKVDTPQVTARLLGDLPVSDLTVEDPPIEDVIERVFAGALEAGERSEPPGRH